ncbi:hypothetical protein M9458_006685, partial [Cirrhinus mrigala]
QSGLNLEETYRGARQIIIHPNYNNPVHDNDIALVQLTSSLLVVHLLQVQRAGSLDGAGYILE